MATVEELLARREALIKRGTSGLQMIRHGDTSTEFLTPEQVREALTLLDAEIAEARSATRVRAFRVYPREY
jgi:hypothetical protein